MAITNMSQVPTRRVRMTLVSGEKIVVRVMDNDYVGRELFLDQDGVTGVVSYDDVIQVSVPLT